MKLSIVVSKARCHDPAIDLRFTYFSDCIVLSSDHSPPALWQMFQSIELLSTNLLQYDVFVRGGFSVGPMHHSKDFVFGTALTEAYEIESKQADGPLVLLSQEVVQETTQLGPDFTQWLKEDKPNRHFVNYLMRYAEYTRERSAGTVVLEHPGKRIAYFVGKRLNNDEGSILEKAQWFQAYWNDTVAARGVLPQIEAGATPTELEKGPTIIFHRLVAPVSASG